MSAINSITPIYNPKLKPREQLINEFVVRTKIFDGIFDDIKKSKMKHPEQHYLLIGQRGAGKTTLLERLKYAIEDDNSLNKWLIPVSLNEEQYNISELANLWETIAETLEDYHNMTGIVDEMQVGLDAKNYEEAFFDILVKYLKNNKKKIALLIDNIKDILSKFDETDIKRLREILMTSPYIRLIAVSPVVFDGLFDYHQPLLEFFNIIYLKGLTREEMELLLLTLGKVHHKEELITKVIRDSPERVEVLRRLTGGIPRTVVMLFNIFVDNQDGKAIKDFMTVIDHATPLYKHNMDDLPIQQQKIVDAVAKAWDGVSVKDIKEKVRMESKNISTQLGLLEKNQLIIKRRLTDSKNYLYMLQDRFFNIWYLMRHGRRYDKKRVEWLVHFFESWLSKDELELKIMVHIKNLEAGTYDHNAALLMAEMFLKCNIAFDLKHAILKTTREAIPESLKRGIGLPNEELIEAIEKKLENEEFEKAIELGKELCRDKNYLFHGIGVKLIQILPEFDDKIAEEFLLSIISKSDELITLQPLASFTLATIYDKNEDSKAAKIFYLKSIDYALEVIELLNSPDPVQDNDKAEAIRFTNVLKDIINFSIDFLNRIFDESDNTKNTINYFKKLTKAGFSNAYMSLIKFDIMKGNFKEMANHLEMGYLEGSSNPALLRFYFEVLFDNNSNRERALRIFNKLTEQEENAIFDSYLNYVKIKFLLWNNQIEEAVPILKSTLELRLNSNAIDAEDEKETEKILQLLIAKEQYNSASMLFNSSDLYLKDRFKPIYYALMQLSKNESELLKMGDELKETVTELVEDISEMRDKYSQPPGEGK